MILGNSIEKKTSNGNFAKDTTNRKGAMKAECEVIDRAVKGEGAIACRCNQRVEGEVEGAIFDH